MLAGDQARKHILTEDQKKQIRTTWAGRKQGEEKEDAATVTRETRRTST